MHTGALCARSVVAAEPSTPPPAKSEPTRLEFRGAAGCSSAQEFATQVQRRSSRIALVTAGIAARSLRVEIRQVGTGGAWRGSIRVVEPNGSSRARELKAGSCTEAVDALSLIAAVTLDPDALAEPAEPDSAAPSDAARTDDRPRDAAQSDSTPPATPVPARPPPAQPPVERAPPRGHRLSVGASAVVLQGVAPALLPGGAVSVAFELNPGRTLAWFGRVSLAHAERRGVVEPGGNASFALTLPTLELCPLRFGPRAFGVRACGYGGLSWMKAWGEAALRGESHERLRGVVGLGLSASIRLSERLEIIVDGRAQLPLLRDAYALDDVVFYRTARLGFYGGAGLSGGFP